MGGGGVDVGTTRLFLTGMIFFGILALILGSMNSIPVFKPSLIGGSFNVPSFFAPSDLQTYSNWKSITLTKGSVGTSTFSEGGNQQEMRWLFKNGTNPIPYGCITIKDEDALQNLVHAFLTWKNQAGVLVSKDVGALTACGFQVFSPNGITSGIDGLVLNQNVAPSGNVTQFTASDDRVSYKVYFTWNNNTYTSPYLAWNGNALTAYVGGTFNSTTTSQNGLGILFQVLTFQNPPGFPSLITSIFGIIFWGGFAYIVYILLTRLLL